jgi:alanyl-tRNA synthetase
LAGVSSDREWPFRSIAGKRIEEWQAVSTPGIDLIGAMTNRLYYTDAYRTTFSASVVDRSDDGLRVYLDETAFYPTSGGQPHDIGLLGSVTVVDVVDEDDRIAHVLSSPLDAARVRLDGLIDWNRRFDHMQQHTGQPLLSAVFDDLFGAKTLSVHFGPDYSTLDVDAESISRSQLVAAEERANAFVAEARQSR